MHLKGLADHKTVPAKGGKHVAMTIVEGLADSTEDCIHILCILHVLNQNPIHVGSEHRLWSLSWQLLGIADTLHISTCADGNLFRQSSSQRLLM